MPPQSRRQKKYDEKLRSVQKRNLIAGVVFVIAIVGSFFLIRQLLPEAKPVLHVSINSVSHSGTREIPFAQESCERLQKSFEEQLNCEVEIHEVNALESDPRLIEAKIGSRDVLIVYLNGHLTDGDSHPDAIVGGNSGDKTDAGSDDDVYWIGPESVNVKKPLFDLLEIVENSNARIKVVLLDAGRFSWSPTFPGRKTNRFQSRLEAKLKEWKLDSDFWVITSHSDAEISNVSTPLKSSLFVAAIEETLKALKKDRLIDLEVPRFYDEIRQRTASYSTNFEGKSLQNPILMKAGVGRVEPSEVSETNPMVVSWKGIFDIADPAAEVPPPKEYDWEVFSDKADTFSNWLLDGSNFSAIPHRTIEKVETFLELGNDNSDWAGPSQQAIEQYETEIEITRDRRRNTLVPNDFNAEKLLSKQDQIARFHRMLLGFSVWSRFRNQMRFWDDNAFDNVRDFPEGLSSAVAITDLELQESNSTFPAVPTLEKLFVDFKKSDDNERLLRQIKKAMDDAKPDKPLSPMQAEILGVVHQRYLPLLDLPEVEPELDANGKKVPPPRLKNFTLGLEHSQSTDPFNPLGTANKAEGISQVVSTCRDDVKRIVASYLGSEEKSDTDYRYFLATQGSEFVSEKRGLIPNIVWRPTTKKIALKPALQGSTFRVPPVEQKRIPFSLTVAAIESIGLSIVSTDEQPLDELSFGFTNEYDQSTKVSDFKEAGSQTFVTTFNVYFEYPRPNEDLLGKEFNFKIVATDRSDNASAQSPKTADIAFSIQITKDADFWLTAKRTLANKSDDESRERLYRWGAELTKDYFKPLAIRTLANVKSPFELRLSNNSDSGLDFTVRAYQIIRYPESKPSDKYLLRSDRSNFELTSNFVKWLGKQTDAAGDEGTSPLAQSEFFELIGETKVAIPNPQTIEKIQFAKPAPVVDPNADPKLADDERPKFLEIDNGILLAFYNNDESGATARMPSWFQLVRFEPEESANASRQSKLKVRTDILDVFGQTDVLRLDENLTVNVDRKTAARMTIVSKTAREENENAENVLNLDEILRDDASVAFGDGPAFLLLDVLGVPNYKTLQSNRGAVSSSDYRSQLTGIRISDLPEGWKAYPCKNMWSFATQRPLGEPFGWLAGRSNEEQLIFLNPGDAEDVTAESMLEFFLPFKKDLLDGSQDDFMIHWKNGNRQWLYPIERRHFVEVSPKGLLAWSEIRAHTLEISSTSDRLLQIFRADDPETPLGQWRFITKSLEENPVLDAGKTRLYNSKTQWREIEVTLDMSKIQPPIPLEKVNLFFDGVPLKKKTKALLEKNPSGVPGMYKFSFSELWEAVGEPSVGNRVKIEVQTTDFFEEPLSDQLSFSISQRPKDAGKPKPKPVVTLDVTFSRADEKPVEMLKFASVQLDGQNIKLDEWADFKRGKGGRVKIVTDISGPSLKVIGLLPGRYSISVVANVKPPGQNQYPSATTQGEVTLEESGTLNLMFK
ncbi:MAG: hypothetical protein AB8B55_08405 [Mariniblastus sp.]